MQLVQSWQAKYESKEKETQQCKSKLQETESADKLLKAKLQAREKDSQDTKMKLESTEKHNKELRTMVEKVCLRNAMP